MNQELLEPNFWSIKKLFNYQYFIPVYQRPYSWEADQIDSLYEDIKLSYREFLELDEEERHSSGLYVGNIILHSKSVNAFDIIDGQQRITTFAIILLAIYSRCFELECSPVSMTILRLKESLWELDSSDNPIQNKRAVTLGSIDKDFFIKLFDAAFTNPKNLKKFVVQYETNNVAEENIKINFLRIYETLTEEYTESQSLLFFASYILSKVYLISINTNGSEVKAFSIFESINSKGKKLDDIDLIKTYIFSKLKENDYQAYLAKWGDLIVKTNDELPEYLKIYLRAYIKYFTQNVRYNDFKKLDDNLCEFFNVKSIDDAYKLLLEDMLEKVDFFRALFDINKLLKIINNNKLKFYFYTYIKLKYEHPRALFFRVLAEYNNGQGNLNKEDAITIIIETIKTMVSFLTISAKDSKDIIDLFKIIFEDNFANGKINRDLIIYRLQAKLQTSGLLTSDIATSLKKLDLFNQNKQLGAALISLYESRIENANLKLSWDEAYSKFSTYGSSYTLDHIMNQTPERLDDNLKYYKLGNNLKLKEGHDFPIELIHDGMEYDTFEKVVLHTAGNLRLKGKDGNSARGNESDNNFCTYKDLTKRTEKIVEFIITNFLELSKVAENFSVDKYCRTTKPKLVGNFDFSIEELDLTGIKAKSITIFDSSYNLSSNKDILKFITAYLSEYNEQKMINLAEKGWKPRKRIIITWDKSILTVPFEILKNKIYVETNLSSNDIIIYSKAILEAFNFPADLVTIYIPE